jgi:hypothetical protein
MTSGIGDIAVRLARLAAMGPAASKTLSVYLDTRRGDEHQRDGARLFLAGEIQAARLSPDGRRLAADLDWIEEQARRVIGQESFRGAYGVALFACSARGVREAFAVKAPFAPRFVVSDAPFLGPLAGVVNELPDSLVVVVDGKGARLIPFGAEGAGESVVLESEVPGHHRRGGWSLLAQSRYQRHIQDHRGRHFEAVADAVARVDEARRVERLVVAGTARNAAAFRGHLPRALAARVVGPVAAARHESDAVIVERAIRLLAGLGDGAAAPRVVGKRRAAQRETRTARRATSA